MATTEIVGGRRQTEHIESRLLSEQASSITTPDAACSANKNMHPASRLASAATVLVADNDRHVCETIAASLTAAGYALRVVPVNAALPGIVVEGAWDVLVFDISAKDALLRSVNAFPPPIRILIAESPRPEDIARALLEFGADACLEKPVHVGLLTATIVSLRRRVAAGPVSPRLGEENRIWCLCPTAWTLTSPCGNTVTLSRGEIDFLLPLAQEPGNAIPRRRLIEAMGHNPEYYNNRRLDTFVSRLRNKISALCVDALPLRSVHAIGYAFAGPIQIV